MIGKESRAREDNTSRSSKTSCDGSLHTTRHTETHVFRKARRMLCQGALYRFAVYIYAERKFFVFFWVHFMSTMIIWAHFALVKFDQQAKEVPEGAPFYWWKRLAPPLEFGSMHAILFQMALIPITMSRFSIANLSESFVDKIIPLNMMLRIHIHLGYTMISIVFMATIFFFIFFGLVCAGGDTEFCAKFTSEIMITGYAILLSLLIIGGTSYYRHRIPYEVFYAIHHLVFIMYFITIAHTFDVKQRKGIEDRSQTFKWFSSTLLFYFCDRAAMHLNHRYTTRLVGSSVVSGSHQSKMVILKLNRPVLFRFKAGQYAFLRVQEIDNHWHPFSIASGPNSSELEFYIQVCGNQDSWTSRLSKILEAHTGDRNLRLFVDVMGPYGTSLAKTEDFSHVLAIGAGTGVVPILSLLKQHVRQLLQLEPNAYFRELGQREDNMLRVEMAEKPNKGSIAKKLGTGCRRRDESSINHDMTESKRRFLRKSIRTRISVHDKLNGGRARRNMQEMKAAASLATQSIYGTVALTTLPILGMALLGLTISWNSIPIELYAGMTDFLKLLTGFFQFCFAFVALFVWDGNSFLAYIDVVISLVSPFADWYWFGVYNSKGVLAPADTTACSLLIGYMSLRLWTRTVMPRHNSWRDHVDTQFVKIERLDFCWVTWSASQVSEILPDVLEIWGSLVDAWGLEYACKVCRISVYVTDQDRNACAQLRREFIDSGSLKNGRLQFGRPDFAKVIEAHTIDLIYSRRKSNSLLAFCGSSRLAQELHSMKISNDMVTAITGNDRHQMEFVSESYGGTKRTSGETALTDGDRNESLEAGPLTVRNDIRYRLSSASNLDIPKGITVGPFNVVEDDEI